MSWNNGGAARGEIPPFTYTPEVTLSTSNRTVTGPSVPLGPDGINGFSFQNDWNNNTSGATTLAATIAIEVSNDPRAFPGHPDYADARWTDITTAAIPTDPTTGAGSAMDIVSNVRFAYVRQNVAWVSGSGVFKSVFAGHGTG